VNALRLVGSLGLLVYVTAMAVTETWPRLRWMWAVIGVVLYLLLLHSLYQAAHGQKLT